MNEEFLDGLKEFLGVLVFILVALFISLEITLIVMPPKKLDPGFTSRSITGWTNTPKKLAWARLIEENK